MNKPAFPFAMLLAAWLAACSATPTASSLLDQARSDYLAARNNPAVANYAPLELRQAGAALESADAAAARNDSVEQVDQLAYVARQKIATAQEVAKQKTAEAAVADAARQRDQLRLAQRSAEAEQARMQAQAAIEQARGAEAARREAQARAAQLQAQLADLAARQSERGLILTFGDVLFAPGQARLTADGMRRARMLADVLTNNPRRTALIEGFTDSTGSATNNLALSQRRADAVREALLSMGIGGERIVTRAYGAAFPAAGNETAAGRLMNRRVEIVLSEEGAPIPARR